MLGAELGLEPSFDVAVVNVTVVVGQTAVLPCSIEYLGNFKVGIYCLLVLTDRTAIHSMIGY